MFLSLLNNGDGVLATDVRSLLKVMSDQVLFDGLDETQVEGLVPACRVKEFDDTELTCRCDDAHHEAYVVLEGRVAVRESSSGLDHVVDLAGSGSRVNFGGLLGVVRPRTSAIAMGKILVLAIDTAMLNTVIESGAKIGYAVLRSFSKRMVSQMDRRLEHLLS